MPRQEQLLRRLCVEGAAIANIGQLTADDKRDLDRWVRAGTVIKFKGRWFPLAGCPDGIGPLKTCYALPPVHAYVTSQEARDKAAAYFNSLIAADKAAQ